MTRAKWHALCAQYSRKGRTFLWGNLARRVIRYRLRGRLRTAWV